MAKGFTLIELLLVIAIIGILGASTTPFLSRFIINTNFDTTVDTLVSSLRKAQQYAMDRKNGSVWGVCQSGSSIRLFSGSCAAPSTSDNYTIPGSITVTNLTTTTFNLRGEPSVVLTVSLSGGSKSATVEVNAAGGITVN